MAMTLIPYTPDQLKNYQAFAKKVWGNTYQQQEAYIQWLYTENPTPTKPEDFTLATDNGQIIGVIHKMRLPWLINGEKVPVPALHNLIVDPKYRTGNGLFLITGSLKGELHAFVPGVKPPLSQAYDLLRCQLIPVHWYRKILSFIPKKLNFTPSTPDNTTLEKIATILNTASAGNPSPHWTKELVQWRFFHTLGPKHLLFLEGESLAIISLGKRKGFTTARLIESANVSQSLLQNIEKELRRLGVQVFLVFTLEQKLQTLLKKYTRLKAPPKTYIYHKDKKPFTDYRFSASAGDFGLESIAHTAHT
jgi:hypothetical protein